LNAIKSELAYLKGELTKVRAENIELKTQAQKRQYFSSRRSSKSEQEELEGLKTENDKMQEYLEVA